MFVALYRRYALHKDVDDSTKAEIIDFLVARGQRWSEYTLPEVSVCGLTVRACAHVAGPGVCRAAGCPEGFCCHNKPEDTCRAYCSYIDYFSCACITVCVNALVN